MDLTIPNDQPLFITGSDVGIVGSVGDETKGFHGFAVNGTASFTLFSWLLGSTAAGNMAVGAPSTATLGGSGTINLTLNGLAAATKYLGSVVYAGVAGLPNPTIVRVDTP